MIRIRSNLGGNKFFRPAVFHLSLAIETAEVPEDADVVVTKAEHTVWSVRNITSQIPIELDTSSSDETEEAPEIKNIF